MKEIIFNDIKFVIGQNALENWYLLDYYKKINNQYTWFHLHSFPSCYVIMCYDINDNYHNNIELLNYGAQLCKTYTKYKNLKNLKICYSSLKKLIKSQKIGEVIITGKKNIILI